MAVPKALSSWGIRLSTTLVSGLIFSTFNTNPTLAAVPVTVVLLLALKAKYAYVAPVMVIINTIIPIIV